MRIFLSAYVHKTVIRVLSSALWLGACCQYRQIHIILLTKLSYDSIVQLERELLNFGDFEGPVCDELWLEIGASMEPKELCYMHEVLRGHTSTFSDPQLVKSAIVTTLLSKLSQVGLGHFAEPIRLGTKAVPAQQAALSQKDYLNHKLQTFFSQNSYDLDNLKALYQAIISQNALINNSVIRGLFERAPAYRQQIALKTIAELSVSEPLLARFLMSFAVFLGVNKESRNSVDHSALIEKIYDCVKNNNDSKEVQAIQFLLDHGCETKSLSERQLVLLNTISQSNSIRQTI